MSHHFNPVLVIASLVISTLSSWMALELSSHAYAQHSTRAKSWWLAVGSLMMGMGIWAMHYVGMLAFQMGVPVFYHWPTVLLSYFAAVLASAAALFLVTRPTMSVLRVGAGSLFMAAGIAGMHYIGMAAIRVPFLVHYNPWLVTLSILLAVFISFAAIRLCFACREETVRWTTKRLGSALLMGAAIPSMHYMGMAAIDMRMDDEAMKSYTHVVQVSDLRTLGIVAGSIFLLGVVSFFASLSRRIAQARRRLQRTQDERDQLRTYQHRLTRAYRQNGVGAWEYKIATGLYHIDTHLHELFNTESSESVVSREFWIDRVHPDDQAVMTERWHKALVHGDLYENEYRIVRKDGTIRNMRTVANVLRNKKGVARRVAGMTWDVTDEQQRKRESAEQAYRFYTTLEAIGDAVISVDHAHVVLYANPVACRLTGWPAQECVGRRLTDIFVTEDESSGQKRRDPVQRCIEGGGTLLSEDGILVARTGQRYNIRKIVNLIGEHGGAVITFQDITAARRMERALQKAATHDALTGLPNRAAFEAELHCTWDFERTDGQSHALCLLDFDRFKIINDTSGHLAGVVDDLESVEVKIINDTSGHLAGDAFLRNVVEVFRSVMHPNDLLARMGGDEFLFLLKNTTAEAMEVWAHQLLSAIEAIRFTWQHRSYSVTGSLGMVLFDHTCPSFDTLLSQADVAMYTAKRSGRNQFAFYHASIGAAAGNMLEMETVSQLRAAIEEDRFELHAQPIVPVGGLAGIPYFELLIRMNDENGKLVSPAVFIPAAECYGMMHHIDRWVIRHALRQYAPVCREGIVMHFAINLSAASLSDPTLWAYVHQQFHEFGVPPSAITFEVTETGMIQNFAVATAFLNSAQSVGSRVALDDFGTGMSSLSYLKQFSLDTLKIDGSFIRKVASTPLDQSIVRAVTQIAHSLGANVVAECVEAMETVELLGTLGVDKVQGWATGRPVLMQTVLTDALAAARAQAKPADAPETGSPRLTQLALLASSPLAQPSLV